jgi:hypothetical protein
MHADAVAEVTSAGAKVGEINVSIGARFLELFSEQLYTSPNKAFEELVSNSWDAGASIAHIGIPTDLSAESASMWVLDDGESMDLNGLHLLWAVADDHKAQEDWDHPADRALIGKFGIGKLATYVLANEVTYICRAADGVVRAVTVDYRVIQEKGQDELHIPEIPFPVRQIPDDELESFLSSIDTELPDLLADGMTVTQPESDDEEDEEGPSEYRDSSGAEPEPRETWTLVVLGSLKARGREVKRGMVKRVLRAALPLGETITLAMDGEELESSKIDKQLLSTLVLGETFAPTSVKGEDTSEDLTVQVVEENGVKGLQIENLSEIVTGEIKIYNQSIATGRSAERARSNGFFINVKGRVINLADERFGLPALSHGVWAKLRVTIRADGLDRSLSVSRETVDETLAVDSVRGLLRAAFNQARLIYEDEAIWPSLSEILTNEWGTVPLTPLLNAVSRTVGGTLEPGFLIDTADVEDPEEAHKALQRAIEANPGSTLSGVRAEHGDPDGPLARYELSSRRVIVNSEHPFYVNQLAGGHEPGEILQTAALVELLSDAYLLELGVSDETVAEVRRYRDQVERLIASAKRKAAPYIAKLLLESTADEKALERLVAEALDAVGFQIFHQAQSNKPEGIATADLAPDDSGERRYRLIYEAKSTSNANGKVSTKDVNVSGQDRHRRHAAADTEDSTEVEHALVVAPNFRSGALEDECKESGVCPMRARDLARLLMGVAATGPLNLVEFREVLALHDPDAVAQKVDELLDQAKGRSAITIQELVEALNDFDNADQLSTGVIADRMRSKRDTKTPLEHEVQALIGGLQMLVPAGIQRVGTDRFLLGTSPERLAEAVRVQAASLPEDQRFDLDQLPALELGATGAPASTN